MLLMRHVYTVRTGWRHQAEHVSAQKSTGNCFSLDLDKMRKEASVTATTLF